MEKTEKQKANYGLIGKDISYSFSRGYFKKKFEDMGLDNCSYQNFDLQAISEFPTIFKNTENLQGLNITIPYKEEVMAFLDDIDIAANKIGAVNTIKITKNGLVGFNTDAYGFEKSIEPYLKEHHRKALILGTGGASKAVAFVLEELDIAFSFVSRSGKNNGFTYHDLTDDIIAEHTLIINCSPVGTFPKIEEKPAIPYSKIGKEHLLFDLIYNPEETTFLSAGKAKGATISNGHKMLEFQAEKSWEIWNR
ncbi:shikimate dehydrogenase [Maribacter caenipelagi]|uniref:Shikimate dehydrogenase n=1 Tax=Maribacter caenipelagi TaxID=1447781 RepID=A0A4R7CYD1_9FLAO|nr:shikimate dehydrogenase [Maribacter caenipelagi]TDS13330.1 shikimate dehydrogenase [Maribacter caenipelagi]|tara:strand:- start:4 stop:756 length:753 start_codon:yes stop_codon:yes gene_type:complete